MINDNITQNKMLINGTWCESVNKDYFPIENPSIRGSIVAEVPKSTLEDVNIAVNSALKSFADWKVLPARIRGSKLLKIADYLEKNLEEIARIVSSETGNAIRTQSRKEIESSVEIFRYYGGLANELKGKSSSIDNNLMVLTKREPYG